MVAETLVEPLIESGRQVIDRCREDGYSIFAAFWLKAADDDNWYLYLVIDTMTKEGPRKSYNKLYASWSKLEQPWVSYTDIKLIDVSDSLAEAIQELAARYGHHLDTWFGAKNLGRINAENLYLYRLD